MTFNIRTAVQSVLAILAGIVAMTVVAFAVEIPVRALTLWLLADRFPDQAALNASVGWMLSQSLYTIPALILGGYVAAWLAPFRGFSHAVAMAILQECLTVLLMFEPPHRVPPWMWGVILVVTPPAILLGGYLRSRGQRRSHPQSNSEPAVSS